MQWEYKIVSSKLKTTGFVNPKPDAHDFENMLNELGRQNWELVSCTMPGHSNWGRSVIQAVFKRPR